MKSAVLGMYVLRLVKVRQSLDMVARHLHGPSTLYSKTSGNLDFFSVEATMVSHNKLSG